MNEQERIDLESKLLAIAREKEPGFHPTSIYKYCDDYIYIKAETAINGSQFFTVRLGKDNPDTFIVFVSSWGHVTRYRPGRWEKYVDKLMSEAQAERDAEFEQARQRAETAFAPIDDANLFADVLREDETQ